MNPDFGLIIYANDSAEQNFDNSKGGAWFFHPVYNEFIFLIWEIHQLNGNCSKLLVME